MVSTRGSISAGHWPRLSYLDMYTLAEDQRQNSGVRKGQTRSGRDASSLAQDVALVLHATLIRIVKKICDSW